MNTLVTITAFIILFGSLVFFHELGHFIFAKRAGILCREFAIGFGPKLFAIKRNETVYTIRLLPLGGYVRMAGEDPELIELNPGLRVGLELDQEEVVRKIIVTQKDRYPNAKIIEIDHADIEHDLVIRGYDDEEEYVSYKVHPQAVLVDRGGETQIAPYDRQFSSKSLIARTLTIVAGPLFNFLLAALIFFFIGMLFGVPVEKPYAQFGEIAEGGVAHQAGLKEGDIVRKIDGVPIDSWGEMVEIIRGNPGEDLLFEIERDGKIFTVHLTPRDEDGVGIIGVHHPLERSFFVALPYSIEMTWFYTKQIFIILGNLISEGISIDDFAGPVGIYASTEVMAQRGLLDLMLWGAVLSINLGIMNLLPIPALDGGRLMFFAIEAIRGKPVPKEKESLVHFLGFALLMLLMLAVTWNDFQRFFIEKNF